LSPFGRTEGSGAPSANGFHFTGRENDGKGLYYYRARYYDPARNRFVTEDPIGMRAGVNHYAYATNNPVNLIDPLGLVTLGGGFQSGGGAGVGSAVSGLGVVDLHGNTGVVESVGGGGVAGMGWSMGGQFQVTTASDIGKLDGWSVQSGGSVTIVNVNIGVEWVAGQDNQYHGVNVNVGWGGGPLAAEVHAYADHSWLQRGPSVDDLVGRWIRGLGSTRACGAD